MPVGVCGCSGVVGAVQGSSEVIMDVKGVWGCLGYSLVFRRALGCHWVFVGVLGWSGLFGDVQGCSGLIRAVRGCLGC